MSATDHQEIEVKFYVRDLPAVRARLQALGARLIRERTFEVNLRFDNAAGDLRRQGRVLRLRRDDQARLTYKGPSTNKHGALSRQEFEFTIGDFEAARKTLEALGYQVVAVYEKYRTVYALGNVHIMLDELPYGDFIEIEGPDLRALRETARALHLDYAAAIPASYLTLFEHLCAERDLDPSRLTFEALANLAPHLDSLPLHPADT